MRGYGYIADMMSLALEETLTLRIKGRVIQVVGTLIKAVVPTVKVGEVCLLAELAALAFRLGDVGTQFGEPAFLFAKPFTPLFLLGLGDFDVVEQGVMTLLLLPEFSLLVAALLTQHGFSREIVAMGGFMARALNAELFEAGLFALHGFTQMAEA